MNLLLLQGQYASLGMATTPMAGTSLSLVSSTCCCCNLSLQGQYASLGMATTPAHWRNLAILAAIAAVAIVGNNTYKSVNQKTTDRKRAAALKELEKEQ